eukprot:TRINITY_DN44028_c0_g1_i1.p1 TRINITY_DN44028_c0_g1~~TRINITY_DN44028_c0_g1_i1.p1  ORF type:complete len:197 (-),score=34.21 TRINITY_DN44028_c0_g1_i1:75-665(-)
MVTAVKENKLDNLSEFLSKYGSSFPTDQDWSDWYGLQFTSKPRDVIRLRKYFEGTWAENFELSLHNVLATALAEAGPLRIAQFERAAQRLEARELALAEHKKAMYEVSEELLMTTDQLHKLRQHDDHSEPGSRQNASEVVTVCTSPAPVSSQTPVPSPTEGSVRPSRKSSWRQPFSMIKDGFASLRKDSSREASQE